MASIREKLQRLHAPRPTEVPAAPAAATAQEATTAQPIAPPAAPAPRPAARPVAPPEPEPLPPQREQRIHELRSRLDRVFNPSMKAAAKRAAASAGEAFPEERSPPIREVTVVPTDEPVMRPRKATKVREPKEPAPRRRTTKESEPAPAAVRRPLVMEPAPFEEPPRVVSKAPLPVVPAGTATPETRHRWSGLRTEVLQARAENDEARALALLHEMAALPSPDAWPHVELARYFETVAHDYERALAHIRIAVNCAAWNGSFKSQLARLESKVRRR